MSNGKEFFWWMLGCMVLILNLFIIDKYMIEREALISNNSKYEKEEFRELTSKELFELNGTDGNVTTFSLLPLDEKGTK